MIAESRLFGTDGVRGLANHYPVTPEMAFALGRAGAEYLQGARQSKGTIVVGRDTRLSGDMLGGKKPISPGTWRPSAPAFVRPGSMPSG